MSDVELLNHTDETNELIPIQFVDKPIIEAVLKTWMEKAQEVEQDFFDIRTKNFFKVAEGVQLDRYGFLLESPRITGATDDEFRLALVEQIMKRSSDSTPDRIREIIEATTVITDTRIFEHFIGGIFIYGVVPETFDLSLVQGARISRIVKAGAHVTSKSDVLGVTKNTSSLWIPSEIITDLALVTLIDTPPAVLPDEDVLGNDTDDFIAVKDTTFLGFIESDNGQLSEAGSTEESLLVFDGTSDQDYLVSPPPEGQILNVNLVDDDFPFINDHGVCLEIDQFTLGDTL